MLSLQGSSSLHNYKLNQSPSAAAGFEHQPRSSRKRKADPQENERLTKRLGRLNLAGQNLRNLYATVEDAPATVHPAPQPPALDGQAPRAAETEYMQLDDSKHKVYIYNLDDELSSSESEPEEGKIVFLPDIERALRANRIPPIVRADAEGRLAGKRLEDMQVVLYNVPSSLTVAPEHDSVRKAIIEARARARRERGMRESDDAPAASVPTIVPASRLVAGTPQTAEIQPIESVPEDVDAMDLS
ncbi:uncharacterized protein DNG_04789 [Cephalotrichum gorgonifer]|uniref:Uncharacterized protein n=1 Tax=Cephalotrichum gorgonifer TaxID=2041049 RepID=A0AAE8SUW7_9PEZI|nr:uncharacterized protein DNG_04789 [Cephalotrichum gorgonifer]